MNEKEKQVLFLSLFEAFRKQLSGYVKAMTRNADDAKDIISDTVLVAWSNFDKMNNRDSLKSYMFTIATRKIKNYHYNKKFIGLYDLEKTENIQDKSVNLEKSLAVEELYSAMNLLPEKQKQALSLFEISGFSIDEIRKIQGGTVSGVKTRLKRAREFLKDYFENETKFVKKNKNKNNINLNDMVPNIYHFKNKEEKLIVKVTNEY